MLLILPEAYAEKKMITQFENCISSKNCDSPDAVIIQCKNGLASKTKKMTEEVNPCQNGCVSVYQECTNACIAACPSQDLNSGYDYSNCHYDCTHSGSSCSDPYSNCFGDCSDDINEWWGLYGSGGTDYSEMVDSELRGSVDKFTSKCEALNARQKSKAELQVLGDEENKLDAEIDGYLNELAQICLGIEGCKPGNKEDPEYINDILNSITKLHSDSCDRGKCIVAPIEKLEEIGDKIVDWNQRETDWESKISDLTQVPVGSKERALNPNVLSNLNQESQKTSNPAKTQGSGTIQEIGQGKVPRPPADATKSVAEKINDLATSDMVLAELIKNGGITTDDIKKISAYRGNINLGKGQSAIIEPPSELGGPSMTVTAGRQADAAITIASFDNKASVLLFNKKVIGSPGAPIDAPLEKTYDINSYFKVDTKEQGVDVNGPAGSAQSPFEDVWFSQNLKLKEDINPNQIKLLRWDENSGLWMKQPTYNEKRGDLFKMNAKPDHTSYFAVVIEKVPTRLGEGYLIAAILLGIVTSFVLFGFRYKKALKAENNNKSTNDAVNNKTQSKSIEKTTKTKGNNNSTKDEVLDEMDANLFAGIMAVGGRLKITNQRLIFKPHALNFQKKTLDIPLKQIQDVQPINTLGVIPNGVHVKLVSGEEYKLVVWKRKGLIELINKNK